MEDVLSMIVQDHDNSHPTFSKPVRYMRRDYYSHLIDEEVEVQRN